jgi:hypothetical protein
MTTLHSDSDSESDANFVYPRRLVFIQVGNTCMFCENPQGNSYIRTVAIEAKMGYIHCGECKEKAEATAQLWHDKYSYGPAHYLKDKEIKVRRSNGEIETGWRLNNPMIEHYIDDSENHQLIICCEKDKYMEKWCFLTTILELNPPEN